MAPKSPKLQLERARGMRREQTIAEEVLWRGLRSRKLGAKFRRQVPIGPYIADFACVEAKVIVEVDGPSHDAEAGRMHDARRAPYLRDHGWRIVRVSNTLVTQGGDLPLDAIRMALSDTPSAGRCRRTPI